MQALVAFEGSSVKDIKKAFEESVDDYIEICKETGKERYKSYKGSFNVRIDSSLHRKAVEKSLTLGISLNQFVQKAIEDEVLS